MNKQILASESFSSHKRHYFLDFKRAENNSNYIQITRSELQEDGRYKRWQVIVFENDLECFIQAFSSLFQSAAWGSRSYLGMKEIQAEAKAATGMKSLPMEDRPREKLVSSGAAGLSDRELLAMLIGSGTPNESALQLAERILSSVNGNLQQLGKISMADLCRFRGMGIAKSSSILAALELASRVSPAPSKPKFIYVLRKTGKKPERFPDYN